MGMSTGMLQEDPINVCGGRLKHREVVSRLLPQPATEISPAQ